MIIVRELGVEPYETIWEQMKDFTSNRNRDTHDELWVLEHPCVFTQGQAGKSEHILDAKKIPIVQSDRGGQVTFHGPGQLIAYVLMDLKRRSIGIRTLVNQLEQVLISTLGHFNITGHTRFGAPGVYVNENKIASLGLRVKNFCTYHGLALNVAMDTEPFNFINPCGFKNLKVTQMKDLISDITLEKVKKQFIEDFLKLFDSEKLKNPALIN